MYCPDYKLAPEAVWPAQLEECLAAYEYLCNEIGAQGENIVLLGKSSSLLPNVPLYHLKVYDEGRQSS